MKKLFLIITAVVFSEFLAGQTVHFSYDDSGNRKHREILYEENIPDSTGITNDTTVMKSSELTANGTKEYSATVGKQTIKIYPNPNNGYFTIKIEGWDPASKADMTMTSLTGKSIVEEKITGEITKVRFHNQPDGTYLLTVILNGKRETWKVVKR